MATSSAVRPLKDGAGLIKLDVPLIAENGAVVPVSVCVDSPMTPTSSVKTDPGPLRVEFLDTTGGRYEGRVDIKFA